MVEGSEGIWFLRGGECLVDEQSKLDMLPWRTGERRGTETNKKGKIYDAMIQDRIRGA